MKKHIIQQNFNSSRVGSLEGQGSIIKTDTNEQELLSNISFELKYTKVGQGKCTMCKEKHPEKVIVANNKPNMYVHPVSICTTCIVELLEGVHGNEKYIITTPYALQLAVETLTETKQAILKTVRTYLKKNSYPAKEITRVLKETFDFPTSIDYVALGVTSKQCFQCDEEIMPKDSYFKFSRSSVAFGKGKRVKKAVNSENICLECIDKLYTDWKTKEQQLLGE